MAKIQTQEERKLVEALRPASLKRTVPKHAYCGQTWRSALLAECVGHVSNSLLVASHEWHSSTSKFDWFPMVPDTYGCSVALSQTPASVGQVIHAWMDGAWRGPQRNLSDGWHTPLEMRALLQSLEASDCLPEDVHWTLACGFSRLMEATFALASNVLLQQLSFAAAFLEDAALRLLLCDGCRYDGRGLVGMPLDQLPW